MKASLVLASLLSLILFADGEEFINPSTWAVLVAGSSGWENYRHEANICHAYHTLISKGIDKDKIILMMYDDIAYNPANKNKGVIINKPNGTNVYAGVKIDYKEKDVNVDTFKNVLLGNKAALKGKGTGRVLESGLKDNVFINFVDHGGEGFLSFPEECFFANDFIKTLKQMKDGGKYGKMVLFIEACESGSMFDHLLDEYQSILVSTSAAPDESAWAYYCTPEICLGSLYSINWMERLDELNHSESLFEQYDAVRTTTLQSSHVNLYGDYRLGFLKFARSNNNNGLVSSNEEESDKYQGTRVNSRDVPLYLAQRAVENAAGSDTLHEKKSNLEKIIKGRAYADNLMSEILQYVVKDDFYLLEDLENVRFPLTEGIFDCYKSMVSSFDEKCFKVTKHTYFLKHMYKFVNVCSNGYNADDVIKEMEKVCNQQKSLFDLIV